MAREFPYSNVVLEAQTAIRLLTYLTFLTFRSRDVIVRTTVQRCCCSSVTPPRVHYRNTATSSIKPEVHNISLRRQKRTEPRPQATCTGNLVMFELVVSEISLLTDRQRQTHKHADHYTSFTIIIVACKTSQKRPTLCRLHGYRA